jgi:hypothetical protein
MGNKIRQMQVHDRVLNPTQAEVWITVIPDQLNPTTEIRGRVMGPRCPYSTTVEVAYPLTALSKSKGSVGALTRRVVIPEPSFWDPVSPFLYQGPLQLWEENRCCHWLQVSHGLRTVDCGSRGLQLNGKRITLHAAQRECRSEEDARRLRQADVNCLLVNVTRKTRPTWEMADQFGFLVIGRLRGGPETVERAQSLQFHASCLGWLLEEDLAQPELAAETIAILTAQQPGILIGMELSQPPRPLPEGIHFLVCRQELLPFLDHLEMAKLIRFEVDVRKDEEFAKLLALPSVMGWISVSST